MEVTILILILFNIFFAGMWLGQKAFNKYLKHFEEYWHKDSKYWQDLYFQLLKDLLK